MQVSCLRILYTSFRSCYCYYIISCALVLLSMFFIQIIQQNVLHIPLPCCVPFNACFQETRRSAVRVIFRRLEQSKHDELSVQFIKLLRSHLFFTPIYNISFYCNKTSAALIMLWLFGASHPNTYIFTSQQYGTCFVIVFLIMKQH